MPNTTPANDGPTPDGPTANGPARDAELAASSPATRRTLGGWIGVFLRGMAMGVAEVIPGVSGGTIAFISGIYDELLSSIARFGPASFGELFRTGIGAVWRTHNLNFLLVLAAGMGVALVSVARLVKVLLEQVPPIVWGFFFGLILASVWVIGRQIRWQTLALWGGVGLALGVFLTQQAALTVNVAPWMFFPGGMLAVTAWILPGISGSLLLLMLGLYPGLLAAVTEFDLVVLGWTAAGALTGLLLFTRALEWLLTHYRPMLLAVLTGVMAGSLLRLWPWRTVASGESTGVTNGLEKLLTPNGYATLGSEPYLIATFLAVGAGIFAVLTLARFGQRASAT